MKLKRLIIKNFRGLWKTKEDKRDVPFLTTK